MRVSPLVLILLPAVVGAQVPVNDSAVSLTPIVVTAEREATPAARVSSSVTVLRGDDLRSRGVVTLADALREVPGAAVVSTGSYGGATSLFLRGGESDYVKVLIDGVAVNQAGGAFNFNALTLDDVDRIEVVRGPVSVLYGTDAVTGVIQIFTRQGRGPLTAAAAIRGGTFGSRRAEASASAGTGRFAWSMAGSRERSDGIYPFNSGWTNDAGAGEARYRLSDATILRGALRLGSDTYHYPTDAGGVPVDSNTVNTHDAATLSLGMDHALDPTLRFSVQGVLHRESTGSRNDRDSPGDTTGFGYASRAEGEMLRRGVEARLTMSPSAAWSLTTGSEVMFDQEIRKPGYTVSNFGFGEDSSETGRTEHTRRNIGTYLQLLLEPSTAWTVTAGVRLDDNEAFGQFLTTRAGIVRQLGDGFRLRGSFGTAFKTPTLEETYGNSDFSVGDPGLKPERSRSWEFGVDRDLDGGRWTIGVTWFDQHFRDLVQYAYVGPGQATYFNVAAAKASGADLSLAYRPVSNLALSGTLTLLSTKVTDPGFSTGSGDVFVKGKELIRRPGRSGRVELSWVPVLRARLTGTVNYVGKRTDVDFGPFPSVRKELLGYATVDLSADITLREAAGTGMPGLALTLRAENALDERYDTVIGFPGVGRRLLAGMRVHW